MPKRNFILLLQGKAISGAGIGIFTVVCTVWLVDVVGRAGLVGLLLFVAGAPMTVMNLFGGVFADYFSKKKIIIFSDITYGFLLCILAAVFYFDDEFISIISLFTVQFILSIVAGLSIPAFVAIIPEIVDEDNLPASNAFIHFLTLTSDVFGRFVGGGLVILYNEPLLILLTGVAFLLSAFSETFIKETFTRSVDAHITCERRRKNIYRHMVEGIRWVWKSKDLAHIFLLKIGCMLCMGGVMVSLPFLVSAHYGRSTEWYAYMMGVLVCGVVTGYAVGGRVYNLNLGRVTRNYIFGLAMYFSPLLYISLGLVNNIYAAFIIIFLYGLFAHGLTDLIVTTRLHQKVSKGLIGRVMSIFIMITASFSLFAFLIGLFIDFFDKNLYWIYIVSGVASIGLIYPVVFLGRWKTFLE